MGVPVGLLRKLFGSKPQTADELAAEASRTADKASALIDKAKRQQAEAEKLMRLAWHYLDVKLKELPDNNINVRLAAGEAAKHLARARQLDPTVTITVEGENKQPITLSNDELSAIALYQEGAANFKDGLEAPSMQKQFLKEAIASLEKSIVYTYYIADAHRILAMAYFRNGQTKKAIEVLDRALAKDPNNMELIALREAHR